MGTGRVAGEPARIGVVELQRYIEAGLPMGVAWWRAEEQGHDPGLVAIVEGWPRLACRRPECKASGTVQPARFDGTLFARRECLGWRPWDVEALVERMERAEQGGPRRPREHIPIAQVAFERELAQLADHYPPRAT